MITDLTPQSSWVCHVSLILTSDCPFCPFTSSSGVQRQRAPQYAGSAPTSAPELQCGRFNNLRLGWCRRSLIKSMNAPEQPSIQLPVGDDVIVEITENVNFCW